MVKDRIWHLVSKKLTGEATATELTELEELLRQHPDMHYAIQHIQDLWKLNPPAAPEAEEAFQKHLNKMKDKGIDLPALRPPEQDDASFNPFEQPKRSFARRFALAGVVFAAITAGLFIWLNADTTKPGKQPIASNQHEISTRNGSRTRVSLPDGSVVWLNAGSKLVYDKNFDRELREVTLTGEAYFDVMKDERKPFVIHAGKMNIKVLGTLFNVKSYPGENITEASLIRGSIEVTIKDRPSEKIILKPNEKITLSNDPVQTNIGTTQPLKNEPIVAISHLNYETKDSTYIETSWVENKLIFRNESFKDLAVRLERWYGVTIQFENEKVQQLRFNGSFIRIESIHQAMEALKITGDFKYSITDNIIRIN